MNQCANEKQEIFCQRLQPHVDRRTVSCWILGDPSGNQFNRLQTLSHRLRESLTDPGAVEAKLEPVHDLLHEGLHDEVRVVHRPREVEQEHDVEQS